MDTEHMDAMREARGKSMKPNFTGRAENRRRPGELRSRKDAIRSFCSECITGYGDDVGGNGSILGAIRACAAWECHLWPWRLGAVDETVQDE